MAIDPFDAPIPGENYTSDTRNYAWHRPPEYTSFDDALEYLFEIVTEEEAAIAIISMMEIGVDISSLVGMTMTKGLGAGKWSQDMALLLAGPLAHIFVIMARAYEVDFDLGLDAPKRIPTSVFMRAAEGEDLEGFDPETLEQGAETMSSMQGGFMSGASEEESEGEEPMMAETEPGGLPTDEGAMI